MTDAPQSQLDKGQPAPNRGGAPFGNRNGMRHGLRAGKLPAGAWYIQNQRNQLRVALEDAVVRLRGEVSIVDAGHIFAACDGYRRAKLSQKWLRDGGNKLSAADRERHSDGESKGVQTFIRHLEKLKLDEQSANTLLDALYRRVPCVSEGPAPDAPEEDGDGPA